MAKTRSQTRNTTIKKEEEDDDDSKTSLLLHRSSNRIAKRKPSKSKNRSSPAQQEVKVEEDTDIKSLLKSASNHSKLAKRQRISQKQINQLIDYVVNHRMKLSKVSRKVNISPSTGYIYYSFYKNDPDKRIPSPRNRFIHSARYATQEQIENLIKYINVDKMTILKASATANMSYQSGKYHNRKYSKDPAHRISVLRTCQHYTQDQKNEFIGYIVNGKMNIKEASLKAKMSVAAGRKHYHKYFDDQNTGIAKPSHITQRKKLTKEQKKEFISYIVDDKMTLAAASKKINIDKSTAGKHYRQYLKDHNMELSVRRRYTQDEINKFIGYIVDGKMKVKVASKKANINYSCGLRYYKRYRKKHNLDSPTRKYSQDQVNELIGYIAGDKMTIKAASKKANMNACSGRKYYRKYLMNQDA